MNYDVLKERPEIIRGGGTLDQVGAGDADLHLLATPCAIGECDVFLSHSWRDNGCWVLNVSAKCLHFRFEFAESQNIKILAKYQNSFQARNAKISAVSTPIVTAKAAFFSIKFCQALSEKSMEND